MFFVEFDYSGQVGKGLLSNLVVCFLVVYDVMMYDVMAHFVAFTTIRNKRQNFWSGPI